MDTNEEKTTKSWGGKREGSGRKKKCAKRMFFSATENSNYSSFSFHNHQRILIINHLSVKGDFSETTIIISRKDYSYKEKAT